MISLETLDTLLAMMLKQGLSSLSITQGEAHISLKLGAEPTKKVKANSEEVVRSRGIGHFLPCHPKLPDSGINIEDAVQADTVVGYLQSGLILLPVRAGRSGRVKEFHASEGLLVGYGEPILTLSTEV